MNIKEEIEFLTDKIEYLLQDIPDCKIRGRFTDAEILSNELDILTSIKKRLLSLNPIILHNFRAIIKNEEGKVIFDRSDFKAENKEQALEILKNRTKYADYDEFSSVCQQRDSIVGFGHTGFKPLSDSYNDINKIEYIIEEL